MPDIYPTKQVYFSTQFELHFLTWWEDENFAVSLKRVLFLAILLPKSTVSRYVVMAVVSTLNNFYPFFFPVKTLIILFVQQLDQMWLHYLILRDQNTVCILNSVVIKNRFEATDTRSDWNTVFTEVAGFREKNRQKKRSSDTSFNLANKITLQYPVFLHMEERERASSLPLYRVSLSMFVEMNPVDILNYKIR